MISDDLVGKVKTALKETSSRIPLYKLLALIEVECGGRGFDPKTNKIVIQFEPHIYSKITGIPRSESNPYSWDENRVEVQSKEWLAFNDAFKYNPSAAMEATSIGLPQILGQHWKRLGYASVGAMWDDFKGSEVNQIKALIKFIETDNTLRIALMADDWHIVATRYNGSKYRELAKKLGREPYDITLAKASAKYEKVYGRV